MELTQKIECTQELYANNKLEKEIPDQIGFLGICGVKHPLKKGPNKIGRDPDTCNIVLNLNSISRQHAVINILNSYDFMLMDLDSANKTKVADKTLQAYIPTPLKNGDMVQFGQVFGVFRLFEEDNDLPMTQALDIPETPVRNQHVSKLNLITTIPESPEVSDRDDSFIVASQPKPAHVFKSPKTNFIKSSGKTITIKPVGSNKIDNVYWNSSKKSDSFSLESDTSLKTDTSLNTSKTKENIHENDTQVHNKTSNFIYEADTQVGDNIASIYNIETQLPRVDNLPEVHKVHGQENVDIDLFTENKENDNNIYNSETQDVLLLKDVSEESNNPDKGSDKNDVSDDIILFDEIENPAMDESFESQALLLPELEAIDQIEPTNEEKIEITDKHKQNIPISNRRDSGSSTDCEDLVLTQNIPERRTNEDDDSTDCEDVKELHTNNEPVSNLNIDDNLTDCEDEIISSNKGQKKKIGDIDLEDLATQIIEEIPSHNTRPTTSKIIPCLEDLPTQIIDEDKNVRKENKDQLDFEDLPTQILPQESQTIILEQVTPFKVPVTSPFKRKRKDQTESNKGVITGKNVTKDIDSEDEEKYYAATQELLHDLCTQRELSPEIVSFADASKNLSKAASNNNKTNTDFKVTEDIDKKIDQFVMNLTNSIIDVDIEKEVAPLKKVSSDSSDFESTPKKLNPQCFLETKLPSTQEIKNYLKQNGYKSSESSKGSETDCSSSGSPHRKKTRKVVKRVDLTTKFENEKPQERVITRERKPTPKMQNANDSKKNSDKIRQARSLEIDKNVEKEAVASISTFTSNKEKSKKKTSKTDSKKSNVSQEINKISENNKSRETKKTQANNRSKESIKIQENLKSKENNNNPEEKKLVQESTKSKSRQKRHEKNNNENNSRSNENEKKSEPKSTRISSKTKDKQNIVQKGDSHVKDIKDEVITHQTEATKKKNTRSKTNRKESNTIDKYLFSTPVEKIQNDETKTIEKRNSRSKNKETTNHGAIVETEFTTDKRSSRSKNKETLNHGAILETEFTTEKRSSRNKNKETTNHGAIVETELTTEKGSSRSTNKGTTNNGAILETEVRRSKRQRTAKKNFETIEPSNPKQSAVYNISSESGTDSPNKLKRQASNFNIPIAKKSKTENSSNVVLRSTPARKFKTHYVLFTAFPCDEVKVKLEKLGAVVVSDIMQCTVVLTLQIKRTFKLLCAVGLGKPIVGPNWVQACVDTNMIVDPWLHLIKDELTEKRFQFNLERILLSNRQFLKGYNVSSTPNIMPSPPEMKSNVFAVRRDDGVCQSVYLSPTSAVPERLVRFVCILNSMPVNSGTVGVIVECSGGSWTTGGKNWICVSSSSDKSLWKSLKRKGATVVSTEFILGGVLRQTIDIERNTLA